MFVSIISTVATLLAASAPTAVAQNGASPTGFAACSVIIPSKSRMIYTNPLPASESDRAEMAADFATAMQQRVYSGEPDLKMLGDCHLEPTMAKANEYMAVIKRGVTAKGMTVIGMPYTPKPR